MVLTVVLRCSLGVLGVLYRSSYSEVFCWKGALKICSKFTGEYPCRSAISITLQSNFIEVALRHGCSPVNLLHIFRTTSLKNTTEWLLLSLLKTGVVSEVSHLPQGDLNDNLKPVEAAGHIKRTLKWKLSSGFHTSFLTPFKKTWSCL